MAYKLEKPYTDKQRADFIVNYNHKQGLMIEETDDALYALLANEMMQNNIPVINENYEAEVQQERAAKFKSEFFETSLGWIRRKVNMKDGSKKDFLSDMLLQIKAGIELGKTIEIITYSTPDFSQELTAEYIVTLQQKKNATLKFIQECLLQSVADFYGN